LFAARDARPMPELPPESAVHLKDWKFASPAEARNAGYRKIGDEYVRIDLAERVIKKAHEARGQSNSLSMDMAFATSLGISDDGLKALMRDAGFRPAEAKPKADDVAVDADVVVDDAILSSETTVPDAPIADESTELGTTAEVVEALESAEAAESSPAESSGEAVASATTAQPSNLSHWRWVGLPKPRPQEQRPQRGRPDRQKPASNGNAKRRDERPAPAPKAAAQPSALALQLAALKGLKF